MQIVESIGAKKEFIECFLAATDTHDCQVIVSEDESEDIEVINQVLRSSLAQTYNTVLCVGAETPVFVTPREGISTKSKIILVVDGVPPTWTSKSNVVTFRGVVISAAATQSVAVNKIERENTQVGEYTMPV